jgi:hypothetical protein
MPKWFQSYVGALGRAEVLRKCSFFHGRDPHAHPGSGWWDVCGRTGRQVRIDAESSLETLGEPGRHGGTGPAHEPCLVHMLRVWDTPSEHQASTTHALPAPYPGLPPSAPSLLVQRHDSVPSFSSFFAGDSNASRHPSLNIVRFLKIAANACRT